MSAVGLGGIDQAVRQAHICINDVKIRSCRDCESRAYRLLRAVLHALRGQPKVNKAANIGAQLPILIRALYYEKWWAAKTLLKKRNVQSFLNRNDTALTPDPIDDTAKAGSAALSLLSKKVSAGEVDDVYKTLPNAIRAMWPEP